MCGWQILVTSKLGHNNGCELELERDGVCMAGGAGLATGGAGPAGLPGTHAETRIHLASLT